MTADAVAGRRRVTSLDGAWDFVHEHDGVARQAPVPMPWQAAFADLRWRSGTATYRRRFARPEGAGAREVALRFGAASYLAEVSVNGEHLLTHEGGWLPFEVVVPERLLRDDNLVEVVCTLPDGSTSAGPAEARRNAPDLLFAEIPHGKQSWYGPVGGLWQGVQVEVRDPTHLVHAGVVADLSGRVAVTLEVAGPGAPGSVTAHLAVVGPDGAEVARASVPVAGPVTRAELAVPEPRLWSPEDPALYSLRVLIDRDGVRDAQDTAFGFRSFEAQDGVFLLNGKPWFMRAALDQDYWPEGIYTPPSLEALEDQLRKAKALGLNMLRCHIKVPDPRYYEVADRMGMLVWTEIPNVSQLTPDSARRLRECMEGILRRDGHHPSIVIWSVVNEDWGTRVREDATHRAWLAETFDWLKALDPTRLVVDNSPCHGNFHVKTDIADFHWYRSVPERREEWDHLTAEFAGNPPWIWSPHGDAVQTGHEPLVCSEFGVWGLPHPAEVKVGGQEPWWMETGATWGEGTAYPHGVEHRFEQMSLGRVFGSFPAFIEAVQGYQLMNLKYQIEVMRAHASIQGYVVTELTDVHWESNGLMDMNRNLRSFAPRFAAEANAEICLVPRLRRHSARTGEELAFPVLVSTGGATLSGSELRWRAEGAEGVLPVPDAGPCQAVPAGTVALAVPPGPSRTLSVELSLVQGGQEVARNTVEVAVHAPRAARLPTVAARDPELAAWLAAGGHDVHAEGEVRVVRALNPRDVAAMQAGARYLVLADGTARTWRNLRVDEPQREQPFMPVVDGDLGIPQGPDQQLPNIQLSPRHRSLWRGDWITGFSWIKREGPFAGLPGGPLLDLSFDRVVPRHVLTGFRAWEYGGDVLAGMVVGWVHKPAALIARRRVGRGGLVATTFRLTTEAPGADPVAEALLDGCLRAAAALPVAGELGAAPLPIAPLPPGRPGRVYQD